MADMFLASSTTSDAGRLRRNSHSLAQRQPQRAQQTRPPTTYSDPASPPLAASVRQVVPNQRAGASRLIASGLEVISVLIYCKYLSIQVGTKARLQWRTSNHPE